MTHDDEASANTTTAKVKEAVGHVTGDRHLEAKGRTEAATGRKADDQPDEVVEQVEDEVRRDHGDIDRPTRR